MNCTDQVQDSTHVGPIQVTLTKTDPKKFKYTLMVVADDKTIEKKDKTADEPVQFYIKGATRPYEIVVFDVMAGKQGMGRPFPGPCKRA